MFSKKNNPDRNQSKMFLRILLGCLLSALSGLMLLMSFPPYGLWPLAWIALVPGLIAQYRVLPTKWSSLAPAIYSGVWLGPFLARLFGPDFGPFFQYLGVWIALLNFFLFNDRKFQEQTRYRWFIISSVIGWVGFEMIRATFVPIIATSGFIGYTQSPQPWIIQPVSIFSIYGLNMVIILINYVIGQGIMVWMDKKWKDLTPVSFNLKATKGWLIGSGVTLALWIVLSLVILMTMPEMPEVRVASLRPDFPTPAHYDEINTAPVRMAVFTEQAQEAASLGAQIIFTPEMMFDFDPKEEYTSELRAIAKETTAYLFLSYVVSEEGEPYRNESVLLAPDGTFSEAYGKNHTWATGEPPVATAGVFPVYDTPLGQLAGLICHDANYTDIARKLTINGAQLIAAPYREFGGFGEQAWTNVLFRAVENRTAMVISGVSTVSGIINPDGSLVALDTDIDGSRLILVGDVTLGHDSAPYTRLGDILGWFSLAGYVFFMIFPIVISLRAKKAARAK